MITLLIGHRGVGKSYVLARLSQLFDGNHGYKFFDLDLELGKMHAASAAELFANKGEKWFRDEELLCLRTLVESNREFSENLVIAAGAGVELDRFELLSRMRVVWLQRSSDSDGRIFLNRPRLNPDMRPMEEFRARKASRDLKFHRWSNYAVEIPEGYVNSIGICNMDWDRSVAGLILGTEAMGALRTVPAYYTLRPEIMGLLDCTNSKGSLDLSDYDRPELFLCSGYELRTDLLTRDEIIRFFEVYEKSPNFRSKALLLSIRGAHMDWSWAQDWKDRLGFFVDLAIECSPSDQKFEWLSRYANLVDSFSYHGEDELVLESLSLLQESHRHLLIKWSPEVLTWFALERGHQWWLSSVKKRSFLPRSATGKWRWYRLFTLDLMPQRFVRFCKNDYLDQPSYLEILFQSNHGDGGQVQLLRPFAAVLGSPVNHSLSPLYHLKVCHEQGLVGYYPIELAKEEWSKGIEFLLKLGLRFAAVTSPLKTLAAMYAIKNGDGDHSACDVENVTSKDYREGINTLVIMDQSDGNVLIRCRSTDAEGIVFQWQHLSRKYKLPPRDCKIAVWGGGGVLSSVEEVFSEAKYLSARTWKNEKQAFFEKSWRVIVWAGSGHFPLLDEHDQAKWKELVQRDHLLLWDLSYRDDSCAREFASKIGCAYEDGVLMFLGQAEKQAKFFIEQWKEQKNRKVRNFIDHE